MEIEYTIDPESIEWTMNWSEEQQAKGKPAQELQFEEGPAVALLLNNDVLFLNNNWWKDEWPEEARKSFYLGVDCSDVFVWACSESEEIEFKEIKDLYYLWKKDPVWGPSIWCMIKRREMPQRPVEKRIRELGIWDLDAIKVEHNLRDNWYDAISLKVHEFKKANPDTPVNYDILRAELKEELGF